MRLRLSERIKGAVVMLGIALVAFLLWSGVQAIKKGDFPGKAVAGYINALIGLGKLPPAQQVEDWIKQAQQQQAAPAIQGEYVPPKDAEKKPAPSKEPPKK